MAYRRYDHRRPHRKRRGSGTDVANPGAIEALFELVRLAVVGLWRALTSRPRSAPREPMHWRDPPPPLLPTVRHPVPQPATVPPSDFTGSREALQELPYRRQPHLLGKGERALWYPLYRAVKGKYRLFCKVRLADVLCCPADHRQERYWFRKIGRYHVDFVVCDPDTTAPLLVVELDGQRHAQQRQQERDRFKDAALIAAGVPVYRVRAQLAYDPLELAEQIGRRIGSVRRHA
jgi:very-short-patch-repair endonuclease